MSNPLVFLANLAWLLASLPGWLAFQFAARRVRHAQLSLLARILRQNAATAFGRAHGFAALRTPEAFAALPLCDYEDCAPAVAAIQDGRDAVLTAGPVRRLQPTSGSTAATKLIPFTRSLQAQFQAAIDPWIASLYLGRPALLFGRHYWSISPSTPCAAAPDSKVPVGFADDAEYLGPLQRLLARLLFAVPPELAHVASPEAFEHLTLLFLLRAKNLRLISVWHPSFLTALLGALPRRLPALLRDLAAGTLDASLDLPPALRRACAARLAPAPARAAELARLDPAAPGFLQSLWPSLRLISCWTEGRAEPWLSELARAFPRAVIQGKGLTATEGIVSFPLGASGRNVCAVRSHYFEFLDPATGRVHPAWDLAAGREYAVILTTGGGLYRYRLHDRVRVTGFYHQAPCLAFLGRDNLASDQVGEKLNALHVEACLRAVERESGAPFRFALLAPVPGGPRAGYALYLLPAPGAPPAGARLAARLEAELCRNYHYQHARRLGQLEPVRIVPAPPDAALRYRRHLMQRGMKAGDIKFQALSPDPSWSAVFTGSRPC